MRMSGRGGRRNASYAQIGRGALSRECPKCGAKPQRHCVRVTMIGTGPVYSLLKTFHKERMSNGTQE